MGFIGGIVMEVVDLSIILFLVSALGFGSSLIHYRAFAKAKARASVKAPANFLSDRDRRNL